MSFDSSSLEAHIRSILTSPNTNMSSISAKGVRQRLVKLVPGFTVEYAREHKHDLDAIITRVYQEVCNDSDEEADDAEAASGEGAEKMRKRKQESDEENTDEDDEAEDRGDTHSVKKVKKDEEEDEGGKAKVKKGRRTSANGTAKKVGRPRKSAATVESEAESEGGSKKKRTKKKAATGEGGGAKGGFTKEFPLSEPLAKVVGVDKLSRPQVVKRLWVYIKEKGLQNPQNGKEILLDDNLKAVFGVDKIDMFAMNKALGKHLKKD